MYVRMCAVAVRVIPGARGVLSKKKQPTLAINPTEHAHTLRGCDSCRVSVMLVFLKVATPLVGVVYKHSPFAVTTRSLLRSTQSGASVATVAGYHCHSEHDLLVNMCGCDSVSIWQPFTTHTV